MDFLTSRLTISCLLLAMGTSAATLLRRAERAKLGQGRNEHPPWPIRRILNWFILIMSFVMPLTMVNFGMRTGKHIFLVSSCLVAFGAFVDGFLSRRSERGK